MKLGPLKKLGQINGAIIKHLVMQNYKPYERALRYFREQGDIWMVSQGEYMTWWVAREQGSLNITVSNGCCQVETSLENGVIEKFPGEFLDSATVQQEGTKFCGEVWITIDPELKNKTLLIELLKREGILNYRVAAAGEIMLSQKDVGPLLEKIETKLRERGRLFEEDIPAFRQIVIDKLAEHNLPLLRVWYHPRVNSIVKKAIFSPRYDVDRAITLLGRIRKLENKYGVSSTLYVRAFCPFYTDKAVQTLASQPWCSEIGLHGEFVTNARKYGDEFKAAVAEKAHIEKLIGRSVLGVCMHGGEMASNETKNTANVVQKSQLLYDTSSNMKYYFPFKKMINGKLSQSYSLIHPTGDIKMPVSWDYGQVFYNEIVSKMQEIYQHNGIFVLMLHPVYFGFLRYLFNPVNWRPFIRFFWGYFR